RQSYALRCLGSRTRTGEGMLVYLCKLNSEADGEAGADAPLPLPLHLHLFLLSGASSDTFLRRNDRSKRAILVLRFGKSIRVGTKRMIIRLLGDIRPIGFKRSYRSWSRVDERSNIPRLLDGELPRLPGSTERHVIVDIARETAQSVKACRRSIAVGAPQRWI